ncbi:MAG: DUF4142 domain-containing protein [Tepidisphaeraceae bacterium]|jgi:putative membrane protein
MRKSMVIASVLAGLTGVAICDRPSLGGQNDTRNVARNYDNSTLNSEDRDFMNNAALGGMFEIQESRVAVEKTATDAIKKFANQMIDDHTSINEKLAKVAGDKMVTIPTVLDSDQQKQVDDLGQLSGADFDKQYVKDQVDAHKDAVKLFQKEIDDGQDVDVKALATRTLPTLQHHLEMAETLNDTMTASSGN